MSTATLPKPGAGAIAAPVGAARLPVSAEERHVRVQLAALYREFARQGWTKMIFNHISARVPGTHDHFLINPYGLSYEEVTASNLVKIDLDGKIVGHSDWGVNEAGFIIHGAVHAARPDVQCVIHHHAPSCTAVASLDCGLLPLSLEAAQFYERVAYYDFQGLSDDRQECSAITRALGDHKVLFMRNHGVVITGITIGEALHLAVNLEHACRVQLAIMSANAPYKLIPPEVARHTVQQVRDKPARNEPVIEAVMRRLDRIAPDYRD
ncbi:MAG: class II aldolase/adducin family protein [Burkholderiales bacterium]